MKFIPASVTRAVSRQILTAQKHSPTILFGAGVVGMVSTVVLASRATLRLEGVLEDISRDITTAEHLLEQDRPDYQVKDYKHDLTVIRSKGALEVVKLYAPAVIVGTATLGCFVGSNRILNRRNLALTAAYSVVEKSFNDYRARVREELGEEKDEEFAKNLRAKEVIVETEQGPQPTMVKRTQGDRSMYARLFDRNNQNWSVHAWENCRFLHHTQQYLNDRLRARGHVFLNEALDELGFERCPEGQVVGWVYEGNGDGYIDFGLFLPGNYDRFKEFAQGAEGSVWIDFNVDGPIWRLI